MEFDESKVYTALNADKLKVGSKCIFADTMATLKTLVRCDDGTYSELKLVADESYPCRFIASLSGVEFHLAYLIAEPSHLEWTTLKVGDVIERDDVQYMILAVDSKETTCAHIYVADEWLTDMELAFYTKVSYPKDVEKYNDKMA